MESSSENNSNIISSAVSFQSNYNFEFNTLKERLETIKEG